MSKVVNIVLGPVLGLIWQPLRSAFDIFGASPGETAAGAALGVFLALCPADAPLAWAVVVAATVLRTNVTAALIAAVLLKPLSVFVLDPFAWEVGRSVNEGALAGTLAKVLALPGVALLGLDRYHVMGALVLGAVGAGPVFFVVRVATGVARRGAQLAKQAAIEKWKRGEKLSDEERVIAEASARLWLPFRMKAGIALIVLLVVLDLVALVPVISWALQKKLPAAIAAVLGTPPAKVEWKSLRASLVRGELDFEDLRIADPRKPDEDLLRTKRARVAISPLALFRRRVVIEEILCEEPRMHVRRESDGRLSVDPNAKPGATPAGGEPGWATALRFVLEEAKRRAEEEARERARGRGEEPAKKPEDGGGTKEGKPEARGEKLPSVEKPDVTMPGAGGPKAAAKGPPPPTTPLERLRHGIPGANLDLSSPPHVVVRKISCPGLEVEAKDASGGAPGFRFDDADLRELADDRIAHGEVAQARLQGTVLDSKKQAVGKVSIGLKLAPPAPAGGPGTGYRLSIELSGLDLAAAEPWLASFCPLRFEKGKALLTLSVEGQGLAGPIDAAPVLELSELVARARDPQGKILGFEAERVAKEVTEASAFAFKDVKVKGTLLSPTFELGDTIKQIVMEGGARYAKRLGTAAAEKAAAAAQEKAKEKLGEKAGDATKGLFEKGKSLFGADGK